MKHLASHRRRQVMTSIAGLACGLCSLPTSAQPWPEHPIRLIVPYPAGGAADQTARLLARPLSERLKTQIVIDNRPGGGGSIGAAAVAKSVADGYTLLLDATGFTVNPSLLPKMTFDAAQDLRPVSLLMQVPMLLVVPANSPYRNLAQLLQAARAQPGRLTFASAGNGSAQHLAGELFKQGHKVFITHIPYRGGAPALNDLMAGQVDMMFSAMPASLPLVEGEKLRALAVTSPHRSELMPQVPTVAESGLPGFSAQEWNGLWVPAGTPKAVHERLQVEVQSVMALQEVRQRLAAIGAQPVGSDSAYFTRFVSDQTQQWARVIKTAGIRLD